MTVAECFATQQPEWHATRTAVLATLHEVGDVVVDPVGVGILIKREGSFCELRPKKSAVECAFEPTRGGMTRTDMSPKAIPVRIQRRSQLR